ncbi:MAG: hypothetical protein OXU73_02000 [Candidatus Campbellbacteria bacterium]|nr:hypothetical protein [Candidatus Campbellbacteria bacterium]
MVDEVIDFIIDNLFGRPRERRNFSARFLLITIVGLLSISVFILPIFIRLGIQNWDNAFLTLCFLLWFVAGFRYFVQAFKMEKTMDAVGVVLIALFALATVFILGKLG